MQTILALLKSRKFWVMFVANAVIFTLVFTGRMPPEVAPQAVIGAVVIVGAYIGSVAYEDAAAKQAAFDVGDLVAKVASSLKTGNVTVNTSLPATQKIIEHESTPTGHKTTETTKPLPPPDLT